MKNTNSNLTRVLNALMAEFHLTVRYADTDAIAFENQNWQGENAETVSARLNEYGLSAFTYVVPKTNVLTVHVCI